MKKNIAVITILICFSILLSCVGKGSYYDQFSKAKPFSTRVLDLNKTIDEIRLEEKGNLVKEDLYFLKYAYEVGDDDSYTVTYAFDEKGCYEVGIDAYFGLEKDAINVVEGIKSEMNKALAQYSKTDETNFEDIVQSIIESYC